MTEREKAKAAKAFAEYWSDKGYEKGETHSFWLSLLRDVLGVEHPERFISFEEQVHLDNTSFIDAMIPATHVMIEQKSSGKDLRKPIRQSDGSLLNPFQQAKRYITELPTSQHPRWVVTCNFQTFHVYNMERPQGDPEIIELKNLEKEYYRLAFLANEGSERIKREEEVSKAAGDIIGLIHDALKKRYHDSDSPRAQHSLNVLCVRLVFCLYAEDAGIFGRRDAFGDYINDFKPNQVRRALDELFTVLNTRPEDRDPYLEEDNPKLAAFPYVNGGLFAQKDVEIPPFDEATQRLLVDDASFNFDWSVISPTIFGAVFESTLNPETRRSGGMHYTSIENIHKAIDPLFLNDLRAELDEIKANPVVKDRDKRLRSFQAKLAALNFFDPACGSGNFLTETYLSLRRMENEILTILARGWISFADADSSPIQVSIGQFYGIEINDFAVDVAKTAMWIAESQMRRETENIVQLTDDFLPLHTEAHIVEGNALRVDWRTLEGASDVLCGELFANANTEGYRYDYIIGNPPFLGYSLQSREQKADILAVLGKNWIRAGKIDYVAGWYKKATELMQVTDTRAALVSTNSITQGEQVAALWKPLKELFGVHIDFAHRTFRWDSESSEMAHVHCVIIGFSCAPSDKPRMIYDGGQRKQADNINAYLLDAPDLFVGSRQHPICDVPEMLAGNRPADGGHLIIEESEYEEFVKKEPRAEQYIKRFVGSKEFINGKKRYCLWLVDAAPSDLRRMPLVMERVRLCREDRLASPDGGRRRLADKPALFRETLNPDAFVVVPYTSSERRRYIPIGFLSSEYICSDGLRIIPGATLYHFGILTSNVHMAWMRAVCGRLKSDYRYSKDVVYNNFPWPAPTAEQRARIEQTARAILDARALYPSSSLADLYDETTMPPELRTAHQANDRAVCAAYGWRKGDAAYDSETGCVAELMRLYKKLSKQ